MYIQYEGFTLDTTSRIYAFHVISSPLDTREFTVNIQAKAFGSSLLKIQDGPGISMARLKRELDQETPESLAETKLFVGQGDIERYVERTYPKPVKKAELGSRPEYNSSPGGPGSHRVLGLRRP
jgi:hypothetical protein